MKNTTTKKPATKKVATKKVTKTQEPPVIKLDVTKIFTDEDMTRAIVFAKIDANRDITANEAVNVITAEADSLADFYNGILKFHFMVEDDLRCDICKLQKKVNWLNRPWYKKLMFWKKEPEFVCPCEGKCKA